MGAFADEHRCDQSLSKRYPERPTVPSLPFRAYSGPGYPVAIVPSTQSRRANVSSLFSPLVDARFRNSRSHHRTGVCLWVPLIHSCYLCTLITLVPLLTDVFGLFISVHLASPVTLSNSTDATLRSRSPYLLLPSVLPSSRSHGLGNYLACSRAFETCRTAHKCCNIHRSMHNFGGRGPHLQWSKWFKHRVHVPATLETLIVIPVKRLILDRHPLSSSGCSACQ